MLLPDVRSGKLERVGKALDLQWAASGATYKHSQEVLGQESIRLWKKAGYNRIRFLRWFFKAEGVSVQMDAEERDFVKCTGAGVEKGCEWQELRASTMPRQLAQSCANSPQPLARISTSMT